jgi:hypothetical protein
MFCKIAIIAVTLSVSLTDCSSATRTGSKAVTFAPGVGGGNARAVTSQAQLQDALIRFQGRFTAGLVDAMGELTRSQDPVVRYQALLYETQNASSSLNIVVNPVPQSNLLDMVAFIELEADVVKKYWVPNVFHQGGLKLEREFELARKDIWNMASQVMTPQQMSQLMKIIKDWREANPDQIIIAGMQLEEFADEAGSKAQADQATAGGLIADVGSAVQATDEARLLGERVTHYAQYAPFLFRMQARLTAIETFQDVGVQLSSLPQVETRLTGLLRELQYSLQLGHAIITDAKGALPAVREIVFHRTEFPETTRWTSESLGHLVELAKEWNRMATVPRNQNSMTQMAGVAARAEGDLDQLMVKGFWLAVAWLGFALAGVLASRVAFAWAKHHIDRS